MNHQLRQGLTIAGLLALLIFASAEFVVPALPRQRVEVRLDATEPTVAAAAKSPSAQAAAASPSVQLYDAAKLDLRRASAPAPAMPKPAAKKPPAEKTEPRNEPTRHLPKPAPKPAEAQPSPPIETAVAAKSTPAARARSGELPGLMVEFAAIGLDRYAIFTEHLGGAFFAYMGAESVSPLGPRISIVERRVVGLGNPSDLAADRPYLVSDPDVAEQLRKIDLPSGASKASVVMMWPRWLDRDVWKMVSDTLSDQAIRAGDVARIEASAREIGGALEIRIEGLVLRANGQRTALAEPRAIRVGR